MSAPKINWLCIQCGNVLGEVLGGELRLLVPSEHARTRGVNIVIRCQQCGAEKVWYTADPIVRAIYQLTDAISAVAAKRMLEVVSAQLMQELQHKKDNK